MPLSTQMIFESWPPISRMVRTSGCKNVVPTACAVISFFTTVAPHMAPTSRRALPVVPTARTRTIHLRAQVGHHAARGIGRVALGPQVRARDDAPVGVDDHALRGNRPDVDAEVAVRSP